MLMLCCGFRIKKLGTQKTYPTHTQKGSDRYPKENKTQSPLHAKVALAQNP
jgi:hypothetical protein